MTFPHNFHCSEFELKGQRSNGVLSKKFSLKKSVIRWEITIFFGKVDFDTTLHVPQTWINSGIYVYGRRWVCYSLSFASVSRNRY
jgi:hypothetical protein